MRRWLMRKVSFWVFFVVCLILVTTPVFGQPGKMSRGQTVYAPAAHNCFKEDTGSGDCILSSTTGLIIRNLDSNFPITLTSIELYSPTGDLVYDLLEDGPQSINPLPRVTSSKSHQVQVGFFNIALLIRLPYGETTQDLHINSPKRIFFTELTYSNARKDVLSF